MDLGQHDIRLRLGEEPAALHRRQLGGIAEHQDGLAERQQIAAEFLVHHRALVDDDQVGLCGGALPVEHELRATLIRFPGAVDHRVDGGCVGATLRAKHESSLARISAECDVAIDAFGDMARQRRLSRAGISEQPEEWLLAPAKPIGDGLQGSVLLR